MQVWTEEKSTLERLALGVGGGEKNCCCFLLSLHSKKAFSSPKTTCTIGEPSLYFSGSSSPPITPQDYVSWSEPVRDFLWMLKELRQHENEMAWSQPGCRLVLIGLESLGAPSRGCGKFLLLPPPTLPLAPHHLPLKLKSFFVPYPSFILSLGWGIQICLHLFRKKHLNLTLVTQALSSMERFKCFKIGLLAFLQLAAMRTRAEHGVGELKLINR